jgi:bifunctional DNA-binding transcriptional regulator/antitoxin component of YhaV-PrlF toxin-antitoxin module
MPEKLIAVMKTSKRGSSLRITLPKDIAEKLNVSESKHSCFMKQTERLWLGRLSDIETLSFYSV